MMIPMHRLSFFIIVLLVYSLLDYYVFQAVKVVTSNFSSSTRVLFHTLYWSLTVLSAIAVVAFTTVDPGKYANLRTFLATAVFMNILAKLTAGLFVFADDIVRLGKYAYQGIFQNGVASPSTSGGISRSEFLSKSALLAGSVPIAAMSFGILSGAYDYRVRRRTVTLKNLPKAFDGIRIAQLSDIHSGSFYNKTAVSGGIDMLNAEKPDLFLFTGDLVNNESKEVADYLDIFSKVKADAGKFSILGNHDYGDYKSWNSPQAKRENLSHLVQSHRDMGWDILLNEHRYVEVDGERLAILGVENWGARGFAKYGNLDIAAKDVEADVKILLSHDPSHWDAQIRPEHKDIDLTLSGHTHGFQFGVEIGNFRWSPSQYLYKQWADLYTEGHQHLYVNRGFGFLGYPGRVGILPEITILELKQA
ncbi:MAG: metallophosphoesterase [Reichenbachiella sp.]|uniref:metallophosphoesterase n=1 Tax=Reichenbachiella sp. TaxID=2184521 RepID=UPI0032660538